MIKRLLALFKKPESKYKYSSQWFIQGENGYHNGNWSNRL